MTSWEEVFENARKIEAEGAELLSRDDRFAWSNEIVDGEFSTLSRFVKDQLELMQQTKVGPSENSILGLSEQQQDDYTDEASASFSQDNSPFAVQADGVLRQLCRAWLKHTYLAIGLPCTDSKCPRKHIIDFNHGKLYKDFSFKGLSAKQRKTIINAVKESSNEGKIVEEAPQPIEHAHVIVVKSVNLSTRESVDDRSEMKALAKFTGNKRKSAALTVEGDGSEYVNISPELTSAETATESKSESENPQQQLFAMEDEAEDMLSSNVMLSEQSAVQIGRTVCRLKPLKGFSIGQSAWKSDGKRSKQIKGSQAVKKKRSRLRQAKCPDFSHSGSARLC